MQEYEIRLHFQILRDFIPDKEPSRAAAMVAIDLLEEVAICLHRISKNMEGR